MYRITVVYHLRPDKAMRAINFFSMRPTLMGLPMLANSAFLVAPETLEAHRTELERYQDGGVIEIRDQQGNPFRFKKDDPFEPGVFSEAELTTRELAKAEGALGADKSPPESPGPGDMPDLPPPLEEPLPVQAVGNENDAFFAQVREHAEKIRPKSRRQKHVAGARE